MNPEPKLAPPGAGVPLYQRLALRFIVRPFVAGRTPWEISEARFRKIAEKIEAELALIPADKLDVKVLVPPMPGLEDSSRFWSAKMVLEHIVIVGIGIRGIIRSLDAGMIPPVIADTAKVKPFGAYTAADSLEIFRHFCSTDFPALLPSLNRRELKLRHAHPWFGKMNVLEWYWLLAVHQGIHLKQLREIRKRLTSA